MAAEYALPVAPEEKAVEQAADELYGLAPGEFTSARDARVKELRGAGDREAANAVKALRKPTVAAWALNQLSRRSGKDLARLLAAGEKLRDAQGELLAGGDRSAFQDAAARERELVAELTAAAMELAEEAGERGAGLGEKVAATLHAAALDEDTASELRAGRLLREREAIGGFGAAMPDGTSAKPAPAPKSKPRKKTSRPSEPEKRAAAEQRAAADQRQRLAGARTDERHARRELEAADKALKSAQARAEAAEAHAADANKRAKTAKQRLQEARRAQTAARKAHARAEKALASADGG
jgi:hypothetical protein